MFNRALQVKLVKSKKEQAQLTPPDISLEQKANIIGYYAERIAMKAGAVALSYVVVDTIRQVVVARALKK